MTQEEVTRKALLDSYAAWERNEGTLMDLPPLCNICGAFVPPRNLDRHEKEHYDA